MFTVLRACGFGDSFIKWVKLLYTDIHSRVLANGFLSDPFAIERSIRQGCGLSMLLYVLCFEPLAHRIRLDPHIEGLRLPGSRDEARFSGYADDATTYTLSVQSIYKTVNLFSNFSLASGALLNRSKCQGLWIGTMPPEAQSCGITWVFNIKICGIYFGPEGDKMNRKNILDKLNKVVSLYKSAAMAMHSKVDLINIIFCSKLWYIGSCTLFDTDFESKLNKLLYGFMWKTTEWVSRKTIIRPVLEGGLAVYDIQSRLAALRVKHICRLISGPPARWHTLAAYWIGLQLRAWRSDIASNSRPHSEFEMPTFYSVALKTFKML